MYKSLFALTLVCTSISSFANPDLSGRNPFVDIQAHSFKNHNLKLIGNENNSKF